MNLQSTDFELFAVPARFAQDAAQLDARWKQLQREVHPDRFAAEGAAAQRVAAQWSARVNQAYRRLKDPLKRAAYLCELNGAPLQADSNTAMPADFLLQQMVWRERLDDAQTAVDIDQIESESASLLAQLLQKTEHLLDVERHWAGAAQAVRMLMFLERFGADLERRRDALVPDSA